MGEMAAAPTGTTAAAAAAVLPTGHGGAGAIILPNQVFLGTFVHSKTLEQLEYLHDTAVFVDKTGKMVAVGAGLRPGESGEGGLPQAGLVG